MIEMLLGSQEGSILLFLEKCSLGVERAALCLRSALYYGVFNYVLSSANKAAQVRHTESFPFRYP